MSEEKRVVVTGGTGFIGHHLINVLKKQGYTVLNIDIRDTTNPIDIRNLSLLSKTIESFKPEIIFHLAAVASVPEAEKNPHEAYTTNVIGTLNVVKIARKLNSKLIFASSSAVYGNPTKIPTSEEHPLAPVNHYGITKLTGEHIIMHELSNFVILRLFNVYGPECLRSYVITDTLARAIVYRHKNVIKMLGTGMEERDFVYIDDVIEAFMKAIEYDDEVKIFNIGSGKSTKISDLVKLIGRIMKKRFKIVFTGHRKGDFLINCADIRKAQLYLKWSPKVTLNEGLKKTYNWLSHLLKTKGEDTIRRLYIVDI